MTPQKEIVTAANRGISRGTYGRNRRTRSYHRVSVNVKVCAPEYVSSLRMIVTTMPVCRAYNGAFQRPRAAPALPYTVRCNRLCAGTTLLVTNSRKGKPLMNEPHD